MIEQRWEQIDSKCCTKAEQKVDYADIYAGYQVCSFIWAGVKSTEQQWSEGEK